MSVSFASLKHLKLPISIIWQIVYIYMTAISPNLISRERSGSVVECLTRDREASTNSDLGYVHFMHWLNDEAC